MEHPPVGASVIIDGATYKVHPECANVVNEFCGWLVSQAFAAMKIVSKHLPHKADHYEAETVKDVQALRYAPGSKNYADAFATVGGLKKMLALRLMEGQKLSQQVAEELAEKWVSANREDGYKAVYQLFNLADGFVPKAQAETGGA